MQNENLQLLDVADQIIERKGRFLCAKRLLGSSVHGLLRV
jgi:hypothetical protein